MGRTERFLIASFPRLKQVNYAVLPNPTWRPLVLSGLSRPEAVCVDPESRRLFVTDGYTQQVVWYQLTVLDGGSRLMTDGRQHVLMQSVVARGLAVDPLGALYIAGRHDPLPPAAPTEAIFKVEVQEILNAAAGAPPGEPTQLWTRENSVPADGASGPQLFEPSGLAVDPFHIFWGNVVRSDPAGAAIVKATMGIPTYEPAQALRSLADNADGVTCLVLTPTHVYYAAAGSVYGVPKGKEVASCGADGALCPVVSYQESGQALKPTSMVWDGDSSIYLADPSSNSIYSFAAGTLSLHILTKIGDGRGVHGLTMYAEMQGSAPGRALGWLGAAAWLAAATLMGLGRPA